MNGDDGMAMHGHIQDMRVDNWGNYCLQRLHTMYEKGELCDLTIQFHNNQILKVHRVVLNLCTEYFAELERTAGLTSGMLLLPEEIEYQALSTIIKFFYTGRLEVRGNQFNEIFKTVRILNVTILLKLLEAQSRKPTDAKHDTVSPPAAVTSNLKTEKLQRSSAPGALAGTQVTQGHPVKANMSQTVVRPLRQAPGLATKTVLARVQSHQLSKRIGPAILTNATNGKHIIKKKLPIWKERKFSPITNTQAEQSQKWSVKDEPARPTRFEWPEMDDDGQYNAAKSAKEVRSETRDIFDAIKTQNSISTAETRHSGENSSEGPAASSSFDEIEQELAEMEKPDDEISTQNTPVANETNDRSHASTDGQLYVADTTQQGVADSAKDAPDPPALEVENGNAAATSAASSIEETEQVEDVKLIEEIPDPLPIDYHDVKSESENPMYHSRLISEVLKAYPDLAKDSRNIKLKIVQKNSPKKLEKVSEPRSKVSYIILKSTSSADCLASPLLAKKTSRLSKRALSTTSSFWDPPNKVAKPAVSPAENHEGPWVCDRCNTETETDTTEFESYYSYRKHLVETHGDKIDARICEHCGYKASKRNLLLYHLYTKHAIPPRNCSFPHCDQCSYVGLTESLLIKHKQIHLTPGKYICQGCKSQFASSALLKLHMEQNANCASDAKFNCPYCLKRFTKGVNLKTHVRTIHKKEIESPSMKEAAVKSEETEQETYTSAVIMPGHILDGSESEIHEVRYLDVSQVSESQAPSSEAEALTNVASSIAASLDLDAGTQHYTTAECNPEESSNQHTIYILDSSAAAADGGLHGLASHEVSGLEVADPQTAGTYIVQDEDGNKFEQVTAYDEYGKQIVYFQLAQEHQQYQEVQELQEDADNVEASTIEEQGAVDNSTLTEAEAMEDSAIKEDETVEDSGSKEGETMEKSTINEQEESASVVEAPSS